MDTHPARPIALLVALLLTTSSIAAQGGFTAKRIVTGLEVPVQLAQPPGESELLFVAERRGLIRIVENGVIRPEPFLDITDRVFEVAQQGLYNFVFHPSYQQNGYVYVYYAATNSSTYLARYQVPVPDQYVVDLDSETAIVGPVVSTIFFHGGGGMAFGPDGKLYIGIGDYRLELPEHGCAAQDGSVLQGKLLRLEDDGSIPIDNPFVGDPMVRDEIFAMGLRQPFRISFDPATGGMYIGDVGDFLREEIDWLPPASPGGANFGWRYNEGNFCPPTTECTALSCGDPSLVAPILDYERSNGCCVIAGHVYHGARIPELQGKFFYADWCFGMTFSFDWDGIALSNHVEHTDAIAPTDGTEIGRITSVGIDNAGELYLVDGAMHGEPPGSGEIFALAPRPLVADIDQISVATGGTQTLTLDVGPSHGGAVYLVLGSASGTSPGIPIDALELPLAIPDAYFDYTLSNPNSASHVATLGALDPTGRATSAIVAPAGLGATLAGITLHHAYVAFGLPGVGQVELVSNPVALDLVP